LFYLYYVRLIFRYKIGRGPFFYWFPIVCGGINWLSCFVLISFQKIIPLILMRFFMRWILWFIIIIGLLIGVIGSFNQINLRKLMAFSSIHHIGWIILCLMIEENIWIVYLLLYIFIIVPVFFYFWLEDSIMVIDIMKIKSRILFILVIIRMGGFPPFLGFFLKWISFYFILNMRYFFIRVIIILSVFILYVYLRIIYVIMIRLNDEFSWIYNFSFIKYKIRFEY